MLPESPRIVLSTIAVRSARASARLIDGVRLVDPSAQVWVLSLDGTTCSADRIVKPDELRVEPRELARRISRTGPSDGAAALLPELARLALLEYSAVLILDPSIEVAGPLDDLEIRGDEAMRLVPRILRPLPVDDRHPSLVEAYSEGVFLPTILTATAAADEVLAWWSQETAREPMLRGALLTTAASWLATSVCKSPAHGINPARSNSEITSIHTVDTQGHDHKSPHIMGAYAGGRIRLVQHRKLGDLFEERYVELAGESDPPPASKTTASQLLYAEALRRHELLGEPEPPVAPSAEFDDWISKPWERPDGLSRAAMALHRERVDLQMAYPAPDLGAVNRREFTDWLRRDGIQQVGLDPRWVSPPAVAPEIAPTPGVDLAGYINAELGVGEIARLLELALSHNQTPTSIQAIGGSTSPTRSKPSVDDPPNHAIEILCVNADRVADVKKSRGRDAESIHSIGVFFWETDLITSQMRSGIAAVDEIWAGSHYVADIFRKATDKPVAVVPIPVITAAPEGDGRALMGVDQSRPVILFAFDFHSVVKRKNPLGLVDAFRRAFAPGEGPVLVLKSINGERVPDQLDRLLWATRDRPDIRVIDRYCRPGELAAMISEADIYASLHRSEGFGLTIAHAMALGTPVICTEGSGPADFADARTAMIIPGAVVSVGEDAAPYPSDGTWREPDTYAAATALRKLVDEPTFAKSQAEAAKAAISGRDLAATAEFLLQRLSDLNRSSDPDSHDLSENP